MSSSLRRGTLAASALALSLATLTACAAGHDAETLQVRPDNAAATVADIMVQDVTVVTSESGEAASLTARIFNESGKAETLKAITLPGPDGTVRLSPAKGEKKLTVPAHGSLALGGEGNASAVIANPKKAGVKNGESQKVTFDLSSTGEVTLRAAVLPEDHGYKRWGPSPAPSATQSGQPGGTPTATPSGEPTGAASPSATRSGQPGESPAESVAPGEQAPTATATP